MSNETIEQQPVAQEQAAETSKPDYIQDKFWDADRNQPKIEALASSYNSLEKKLGSRTDELSKQVREDLEKERLAAAPENYQVNIGEIPDNVTLDVSDDMPIVQWWKETAKSNGLSQEQFDKGVEMFVNNALDGLPQYEEEVQKLGENGKERIEAAELWSKKNLSEDAYSAMSNLAATAEGIKAIEEIMKMTSTAPMPTTPTQIDATPNIEDLRSMMNDPRYWDSARRDQAYVDRITKLYEAAYAAQNKKG